MNNTVAGQSIAGLTVQVVDQFGNLVPTSSANVTVAIGTNAGGGTLSGTTTIAAVNGIATFTDLSIDKTGTAYTLKATTSGLGLGTSNTFNVTPAAADHLLFSQQPTDAIAGVAFNPAVKVQVLDVFNNLVTTDSSNVTLGFGTNAGSGSLLGTTTVAAVNGVATFNVSVDKVGSNYTLSATDLTLPQASNSTLSSTFTISPNVAHHLGFGVQPSNSLAGQTISPAVTVQVLDQFGNVVTSDNSTGPWPSAPTPATACSAAPPP